jgi:uncharacterized protein
VVIAALTAEAATARVQAWLGAWAAGELAISEWGVTEVSSALSMKVRTGDLDLPARARVLAAFNRLVQDSLIVIAATGAHFHTAARFADRHELGIRAGDALHLAIAAGEGATLYTLDRRLFEAGPALGVATAMI